MQAMTSGTATATAVEADSSEPAAELPGSHAPLGRKHRVMQLVEEVFRIVEPLRKATRFTVAELQSIVRATSYSPVLVSKCDLETLKVFSASSWAPVVIITSPVGPKHVRAVVGYDDATGRISLTDPVSYTVARLEYSEFSKQWDDPQKTCLLIFSSRQGNTDKISSALKKYLTEEKADSVSIKTAGKR